MLEETEKDTSVEQLKNNETSQITEATISDQVEEQPEVKVLSTENDQPNTNETPIVEEAVEEEDQLLETEKIKFLEKSIKFMKKKKDAVIFLYPVDPVALNIPTYFTVIKHPMDISTIEKKISANEYKKHDEIIRDLNLMFDNCLTFNGSDGPVSQMAKNLSQWLVKEVAKMPTTMEEFELRKKKKTQTPQRRESFAPREELGKRKQISRKVLTEMKFCNYVHREVTRKQYKDFVWPFLTPVDPIALGIPHYRDIIKEPMDLSTMRKKLDLQEYSTPDEFESDFRLMLQNCFTFNTPDSDIHKLGKQLLELFEQKWAEKVNFLSQHEDNSKSGRIDSDDDDDEENEQHIQMIKTQLELLNQQLQSLLEKRKRRKNRRSVSHSANMYNEQPSAVQATAKKSKPKKTEKKRKRPSPDDDDEKMPEGDITYEQKRELSDNINILPPNKLPQVFEIIKENTKFEAGEDEEIELDIDSLDKAVLWKLYLFVKKNTRQPKRPKLDVSETPLEKAESSGSESDSDESDFFVEDYPKIKIKPLKKKAPTAKRTGKTSTNIVNKKRSSKPSSPVAFRMEQGDTTTYASNFVATKPANTIQSVKQPKAARPKYDSVLDSAWDALAELKPVVAGKQPSKEPPKEEKCVPIVVEPVVESSDDDDINSPLDLQGPADLMNNILEEFDDMEGECARDREGYLQYSKGRLDRYGVEQWILNDDQERFGSDEEGAI